MRLFLLPISTRRTLLYCQKSEPASTSKPSLVDRVTTKANETWAAWEKRERGWQKKVTELGNVLLRRIPFEEWGLKTVPPLSARRRQTELSRRKKVQVCFPSLFLPPSGVPDVLGKLAMERQSLHRRKMIWSLVGIPITLPFALVPVIPNLPGFYLAFRAYSHYKALRGSQHLEFLVDQNLYEPVPSPELDSLYAVGLMSPARSSARTAPAPTRLQCEAVAALVRRQTRAGAEDVMLLQKWNGKLLAERFHLPDMEVEIERAVEQVEQGIKDRHELAEEKREIEQAAAVRVEAHEAPRGEGEKGR